ncbi:MAG: nucleoside transporter C-terminal domain-containing protein [Candidatus Marinimicrobia bacterium]|jgi:CNT family concentrative nucleoside transporter|nr:nucleoside transporter C-terminal domain-containing protein [Candidatus Neomarinimicrobiota bacterium]MDP6936218.1 nucleoside transporter C-terminal domain-containing protein [Candidatus Neomarinimicrobiota bacterium]
MNIISILGLLVLLGSAWLISYHRSEVNLKPVIWGIGLQFLFALIILKEDGWSFLGMTILASLLITYQFKGDEKPQKNLPFLLLSFILSCAAVYSLSYLTGLLPDNTAFYLFLIAASGYIINSLFKKDQLVQKLFLSLFLICGITVLVMNGLYGKVIIGLFSDKVKAFLDLSDWGSKFLFGNLADENYFGAWKEQFPNKGSWPGFGFQFAFKVLPTIVFFGGFMSVLYYLGIMQKVIQSISRFMRWTIGTSGAETLSCSANIFVGQTEAPLLIKPFLNKMTQSELLTIMVGGFATIAGGVLAGYIAMGVPAGHLIAASVMSAPAALVIGKIIFPEKEHSETAGDVELPDIDVGANVVEAASNGITDGLKLAVNVGAMLIGFIALIAVVDVLLNFIDTIIDGRIFGGVIIDYAAGGMSPVTGEYTVQGALGGLSNFGYFPGSLQSLFGAILAPLAFLMGVPWNDAQLVGNLLGIKLSLNEFVAFGTLGNYISTGVLSERAMTISAYALCGFANFSSIGIQIGGISAIAPSRKSELAKVGIKAMIGGAIASWLTATIAGIFI